MMDLQQKSRDIRRSKRRAVISKQHEFRNACNEMQPRIEQDLIDILAEFAQAGSDKDMLIFRRPAYRIGKHKFQLQVTVRLFDTRNTQFNVELVSKGFTTLLEKNVRRRIWFLPDTVLVEHNIYLRDMMYRAQQAVFTGKEWELEYDPNISIDDSVFTHIYLVE